MPQEQGRKSEGDAQEPHPVPSARPQEPPPAAVPAVPAKEAYARLIDVAEALISGCKQDPPALPDLDAFCDAVDQALACLRSEPSHILGLTARSTPQDARPGICACAAVLALALGREMGWQDETCRAAGIAAVLRCAGPGPHKIVLDQMSESYRPVAETVLAGSQAIEAQVVRLCEAYAQISHPRPNRPEKTPHDTLRHLIELSGGEFDGGLIKMLWETLTIFPPGCYVQLNTGEVAKVVKVNRSLPTRPLVQVVAASANGGRAARRAVDLAQTPGVSIEKAVDECRLPLADRSLLLELRAQRLWVR